MIFDKINIGVVIDSNNVETNGGSFSYYTTLLKAIDDKIFDKNININLIDFDGKINLKFNKKVLKVYPQKSTNTIIWLYLIAIKILSKINLEFNILNKRIKKFKQIELEKNNIDILYYLLPYQNELDFPYIITHWDLGHKSTYAFPELVMNSSFNFRDKYHKEILNKAFKIFVESEDSVNELSVFENISSLKINIIPLFPSEVVNINCTNEEMIFILNKYHLKYNEFFFYPAQFWSHKNHFNLLLAFKKYLKDSELCKLVLTGSDKGNYSHIVNVSKELGIFDRIVFTGFVNNLEIYTFYKNSISIVMPTFLGPTNMPLIEAYELDCKIICSNLPGHINMLGDNALYFSPDSPGEIYTNMKRVKDHVFPSRKKGYYSIDNSIKAIEAAFKSIINVRNTFGKTNTFN